MANIPIDTYVTKREVALDEVALHVAEAGPSDGPLVLLLHGFPEFWYSWRHQIPALAEAGYRVVVPDMRGYDLSEKPTGVRRYRIDTLAEDVAQLIAANDRDRAAVVGHDWGAAVAWAFAMRKPELLERLAILNVPHPVKMMKGIGTWDQMKKSWYIFFFQIPYLPENAFRSNDYRWLRAMLKKDPVREDAFSDEDIERYVEAIARPGALTAAIHYYRAALRYRRAMKIAPIEKPTLVIWGEQDRYLGKELADPPSKLVPQCRVERLPDASHWVQVDRPDRVNQLLLDFLEPNSFAS